MSSKADWLSPLRVHCTILWIFPSSVTIINTLDSGILSSRKCCYDFYISFFSFTLYSEYSNVGSTASLVLRYSAPHFLSNSGDIAWEEELNGALCLDTTAKKSLNILFPQVGIEPTTCRVIAYTLVLPYLDWPQDFYILFRYCKYVIPN